MHSSYVRSFFNTAAIILLSFLIIGVAFGYALNLKTKRFWSETEQRFITLKVTTKGMRIIEKNGLDATLKAAQEKGYVSLV